MWAVEGGNKLVCSGLLKMTKANVIHARVMAVSLHSSEKKPLYEVQYERDGTLGSDYYDVVIIAAPLQKNRLPYLVSEFPAYSSRAHKFLPSSGDIHRPWLPQFFLFWLLGSQTVSICQYPLHRQPRSYISQSRELVPSQCVCWLPAQTSTGSWGLAGAIFAAFG